jgi:hypothetical protein
MLAHIRQGAPPSAIKSMLSTLQKAVHHVKTAYGVSERHYGGATCDVPLQGMGQGNGDGPAGWAAVSAPLIQLMVREGFGFSVSTALSNTPIKFACYSFVDDTDLPQTAPDVNTSGLDTLPTIQAGVDMWEGGLRATGGALVPSKSHWYLIDFKWQNNKWQYLTKEEASAELSIRDADGVRHNLRRCDPSELNETLGIHIAMDGNWKDEIEYLHAKATKFQALIRAGFLTRNKAWYSINATIMKTLEYPMIATSISHADWEFIMKPILKAGLPASGFARTIPRKIVYGPEQYLALGIKHPYILQGLYHLCVCLEQSRLPTITSDLLTCTIENLKLESGLPGSPFDHPFETFSPCITISWIRNLWAFLDAYPVTLRDNTASLFLQREHDIFLMQTFVHHGYRKQDLVFLNQCRMFLSATTLTDISTADGQFIIADAWEGKRYHHASPFNWPRQPPTLSRSHWTLWKQALSKFVLQTEHNRRLRSPLGDWTRLSTWTWFFSPSESRLYHRDSSDKWTSFRKMPSPARRLQSLRFEPTNSLDVTPPRDLLTATTSPRGRFTRLLSTGPMPLISEPIHHQPPSSLSAAICARDPDDRWAIDEWSCNDGGSALARAISEGIAIAVSDGSFMDSHTIGTSAFLLEPDEPTPTNRFIGVNFIPGSPKEQSAYRSKLGGASGIIAAVESIVAKYQLQSGSITIGLDGEQAMWNASDQDDFLDPKQACFDMLSDIHAKTQKSVITYHWRWVEGHQIDKGGMDFAHLDRWGQLNHKADRLAKAYALACTSRHIGLMSPKHSPTKDGGAISMGTNWLT